MTGPGPREVTDRDLFPRLVAVTDGFLVAGASGCGCLTSANSQWSRVARSGHPAVSSASGSQTDRWLERRRSVVGLTRTPRRALAEAGAEAGIDRD